jgi:hypothetical protein
MQEGLAFPSKGSMVSLADGARSARDQPPHRH